MQLSENLEIHRNTLFVLLLGIFFVAYLITPYWFFIGNSQLFTILNGLLTVLLAVGWAFLASGMLLLRYNFPCKTCLLFVVCGIVLINLNPMTSEIAWRGDEDFHVMRFDHLGVVLERSRSWAYSSALFLLLGFVSMLALARRLPLFGMALFGLTLGIVLVVFMPHLPLNEELAARYPFLLVWIGFPPLLFAYSLFETNVPEWFYRLVPLSSTIALVMIYLGKSSTMSRPAFILVGASVATLPLVYNYSSLLYLEMPAVLFMTLGALSADKLIKGRLEDLKRSPAWYGLLCLGFVKETVFPFLFAFIGIRMLYQLRTSQLKTLPGNIIQEACFASLILIPWLYYIAVRSQIGIGRSFEPNWLNLFDMPAWTVLLQSLITQLGPFLLLAGAGLWVLHRRQPWAVLFLLAAALSSMCFHILDNQGYAGYSRFNLFVLPSVLALSLPVFLRLAQWRPWGPVPVLAFCLTFNVLFAPFYPDGSRKPGWGDPKKSVVEWSYPWRSAGHELSRDFSGKRVLIAGLKYPYGYMRRYVDSDVFFEAWEQSKDDSIEKRLLEAAMRVRQENFDALLFVPVGNGQVDFEPEGLTRRRVFRNQANKIWLFVPTGL